MNNKEFIAALARRTGKSRDQVQDLVLSTVQVMSDAFDEAETVTIANFGTFEAKKRAERVIVNPSTNQRQLVPPKIVLTFKPAQQVRDALRNQKKGGQS